MEIKPEDVAQYHDTNSKYGGALAYFHTKAAEICRAAEVTKQQLAKAQERIKDLEIEAEVLLGISDVALAMRQELDQAKEKIRKFEATAKFGKEFEKTFQAALNHPKPKLFDMEEIREQWEITLSPVHDDAIIDHEDVYLSLQTGEWYHPLSGVRVYDKGCIFWRRQGGLTSLVSLENEAVGYLLKAVTSKR